MLRLLTVAALAASLLGGVAKAADLDGLVEDSDPPDRWTYTGPWVAVTGNAEMLTTELEERREFDGVGSKGVGICGEGGYDYQFRRTRIVAGAVAEACIGTVETQLGPIEAEQNFNFAFAGRLGAMAWDQVLLYAVAGWRFTELEVDAVGWSEDFDGPMAGLGIESMITKNWLVRVQGDYTWYGDERSGRTDVSPDALRIKAGVGYKF